jgi:hypothetical protein
MQDIDDVLLREHCKQGAFVVTYFWVPHKKWKKYKKNTHKKIYLEGIKKNKSEKTMLELP